MERHPIDHQQESGEGRSQRYLTIDMLSDDALLEIFSSLREICQSDEFYLSRANEKEWWIPLVHTCQRWRHIIFASPFHLRLALSCEPGRSVRNWKSLDIWPNFPISVCYCSTDLGHHENVVAALEHRDRVSEIEFDLKTVLEAETFAAVMQGPFPALKFLFIRLWEVERDIPEAFLDGCAPSLRTLILTGSTCPALPRLFLSAPHLISLTLDNVPIRPWISSEAMATSLATLVNLEDLCIGVFSTTSSHPHHVNPPSLPRAVLPALTCFSFGGVSEYLEDFLARIDAPILQTLSVLFDEEEGPILNIPQLYRFVRSAEMFKIPNRALLKFVNGTVSLKLEPFELEVKYLQDPNMKLICHELSPFISNVDCLDLYKPWAWEVINRGPLQLLELFRPFIAAQRLRVSTGLCESVALALQELVGEKALEVLPKLQTLVFGELQPGESITAALEPFIVARQLCGHPVVIHIQPWDINGSDGQDR